MIRLASDTLTETSKDLLVAARLTEALTKEHGFGGTRDGLRLMRRLVEECWDRLNPAIESEDDLEIRAAPFYWLDEPDRGARFPFTLRQVPMVSGAEGQFGWLQWRQSQSGKDGISPADIEKVIQATPREHCQAMVDDLTEIWQELDALAKDLNSKIGQYAPSFVGLRQAVGECRALAQQILQQKGPELSEAGEGGERWRRGGRGGGEGGGSVRGRANGLAGPGLPATGPGRHGAPATRAAQPDPLPDQPGRRAGGPLVPRCLGSLAGARRPD